MDAGRGEMDGWMDGAEEERGACLVRVGGNVLHVQLSTTEYYM